MIELYGGQDMTMVGVRYEGDEPPAVAFALRLYADQIDAGRVVADIAENPDAQTISRLTRELGKEIESGLTTVTPGKHRAIAEVCLPHLVRMHKGLSTAMYPGVCELLRVTPAELFMSALEAQKMLEGRNTHIEMMTGQP